MAHVILLNDNAPVNIGTDDNPLYLNFQTRAAGVYAIASILRRNGYTVKVIDHVSRITFAGIKKIIQNNSENLLWVGLGTTFFNVRGHGLKSYQQKWSNSEELYFDQNIAEVSGVQLNAGKNFVKTSTELVWGSDEINNIANWCSEKYNIPLLIGGATVSNMVNGNFKNLAKNVHIIEGRGELAALTITKQLSLDPSSELALYVSNDSFDNVEFKWHGYQWTNDEDINSNEWLPIEVSRGCAFNCSYCNYDRRSRSDSYKNPKTLREELIKNYENFGVTKYILVDDLYNDDKDKVRILYDEVWSRLPFNPEWTSYMRLDMFWADPESIEIVKASGARNGSFGIETLHNIAGRKVGKGLGRERIIETLFQLKKNWGNDVIISAFFIAGLPDEPEESILDTIDWYRNSKLIDNARWSPLWITPPNHKHFVLKTSQISDDNNKYGISWIDDNIWINKQGVTLTRANETAAIGNSGYSIGGFGHYIELRNLGWSHEQVRKYICDKDPTAFLKDFSECSQTINNNITQRVKKYLVTQAKT
jgi:Radical SAM superfamily